MLTFFDNFRTQIFQLLLLGWIGCFCDIYETCFPYDSRGRQQFSHGGKASVERASTIGRDKKHPFPIERTAGKE
jgi:hypothetical protein